MFVTTMKFSDFPSEHAETYDLDTGKKIRCIWANDKIGEYCEYVRDDEDRFVEANKTDTAVAHSLAREGDLNPIVLLIKRFVPRKRICYGNIKIIDTRKEVFKDGRVMSILKANGEYGE